MAAVRVRRGRFAAGFAAAVFAAAAAAAGRFAVCFIFFSFATGGALAFTLVFFCTEGTNAVVRPPTSMNDIAFPPTLFPVTLPHR
jgi:hypothetical protein